ADLGADFGQVTAADADADDVAQEFANRREGSVADALEESHQRGQAWPQQARPADGRVDRRVVRLLTAGTPARDAAMFGHDRRLGNEFDLLDNAGRFVTGLDGAAAVGAMGADVVDAGIDLIGSKGRALMARVPRLGTDLSFALALGPGRALPVLGAGDSVFRGFL